MSRSRINPITQPDETTCGPTSLKIALKILGKSVSLTKLISLCRTDRTGTSTANFIRAINRLGLAGIYLQKTTCRHINSILSSKNRLNVAIVSYLYDRDRNHNPDINSGHFAVIASFSPSRKRIIVFDSYTGKRKSYGWNDFRDRWLDIEKNAGILNPVNSNTILSNK